uniref:FYVE-type domain-containing protein n=1 Tax=Panagrellus redivivus TaxID=6233 RepID=A0A7E4UZI4_PANRE
MVDPTSVSSNVFEKTMYGLRKLVNKPRVDDWAPMAKFFHADEALNRIARELDSFDGRRDPDRCNVLVSKLRQAQDRVLLIINEMLTSLYPLESDRANRDFRAKFPDEVIHDNLSGQLWFGAECLAAGSNIVSREAESDQLRPLARALTKHLDLMREMLKDQALKDPTQYTDRLKESLLYFDHLFADFEFNYVSVMVEVKSVHEYDRQQDIAVLFSEAAMRAQKVGYITQEQIEYADPVMMIGLPRLAVLWGLLYFPDSLKLEKNAEEMSVLFRHFQNSLIQCRNVLKVLKPFALKELEKRLLSGSGCDDFVCGSPAKVNPIIPEGELKPEEEATLDADVMAETEAATTAVSSSVEKSADDDTVGSLNDECQMELQLKGSTESKVVTVRIEDLIQFMFKRIAAVADQLQTNFSQEFRKIMKSVMRPVSDMRAFEFSGQTSRTEAVEEETGVEAQESMPIRATVGVRWVPDSDCMQCTSCGNAFTVFRRRHHCRNCGRLFCHRCSAQEMPIPELGYDTNVRVCNLCYLYKVNPFTPAPPSSDLPTTSTATATN